MIRLLLDGYIIVEDGEVMRNNLFYKKIFGENFILEEVDQSKDIVQIFDVQEITSLEDAIFKNGGQLTVPLMQLDDKKRVAYYCDPDGYIFALLEDAF